MRTFLAMAVVLPMMMSGCGGSGAPALDKPGVDPPAEVQKNWMEESRKRGGPSQKMSPPETEEKSPTETEEKK